MVLQREREEIFFSLSFYFSVTHSLPKKGKLEALCWVVWVAQRLCAALLLVSFCFHSYLRNILVWLWLQCLSLRNFLFFIVFLNKKLTTKYFIHAVCYGIKMSLVIIITKDCKDRKYQNTCGVLLCSFSFFWISFNLPVC